MPWKGPRQCPSSSLVAKSSVTKEEISDLEEASTMMNFLLLSTSHVCL